MKDKILDIIEIALYVGAGFAFFQIISQMFFTIT